MVTGLEGSIMECHPEGSLLPKAAMFYYTSDLAWMSEFTDINRCFYYTSDLAWTSEFTRTKLLVSAAAMVSIATYMATSMRETWLPCYDDLTVRISS